MISEKDYAHVKLYLLSSIAMSYISVIIVPASQFANGGHNGLCQV